MVLPLSSAETGKEGRQKLPNASWYGSVASELGTGVRKSRIDSGGGGMGKASRLKSAPTSDAVAVIETGDAVRPLAVSAGEPVK